MSVPDHELDDPDACRLCGSEGYTGLCHGCKNDLIDLYLDSRDYKRVYDTR